MPDNFTPPTVEMVRVTPPRRRPTLVWIIPLLAVALSLGLGIKALIERGPQITLQFARAEGLEPNKTQLKYKDVNIGTVTEITLNPDRSSVQVKVQVNNSAKGLLVEDSRFWVVRPRVTVSGVSGLATLLSGVHIAIDPGQSPNDAREFVGLEEPPAITSDTRGRQFKLSSDTLGSLDIGAPVYYRRIPVGRVIGYAMQPDGRGVDLQIFVNAPYDRFVSPNARFWHASGLDVAMDADGVKVNMQSVLSLMLGGIAFSSPEGELGETLEAAPAGSTFILYPDLAKALRIPDSRFQKYVLIFHESVRGLTVGAPVDFRGITAGEVSRIDLDFDQATKNFSMAVEIKLYPERLSRRTRNLANSEASNKEIREVLNTMVARGFRAQLRTGNIISGQRYVALDYFLNAKPATMRWTKAIAEMPTQPGSLDSLQDQLETIASTLQHTLQHADKLITRLDREVAPELADTLRDARKTLDHANKLLASDAPMQQEIRDTLREVGRAADAVRNLADLLERQPEALFKGKQDN